MAISASVIFCDDIRVEGNGKLILIGLYPADLVPGFLPQMMTLSIWVRLRGLAPGAHNARFTLGVNGVTQTEAEVALVAPESKEANLSIIGLPIELKDYGRITFSLAGFPGGETVHEELPIVPAARAHTAAKSPK